MDAGKLAMNKWSATTVVPAGPAPTLTLDLDLLQLQLGGE